MFYIDKLQINRNKIKMQIFIKKMQIFNKKKKIRIKIKKTNRGRNSKREITRKKIQKKQKYRLAKL